MALLLLPQRGDADQDVSFVAVGAVPEDDHSPHSLFEKKYTKRGGRAD